MAGNTQVMTYLLQSSTALAVTYLQATAEHLQFYEALLGPYPFPKFAVVENFFPTGYGFPSYTLLGSTVLHLPFIPQTSLKHEVAHSWWGNGVFVDYESGNWCEGLTTYVADYLTQERASTNDGRLYRQQMLRDYATLVGSGRDFPLRSFTSRIDPATRAVGYGKAAFVFHMVRQKLGDGRFWEALRRIYRERLFKSTSWEDFRKVFVESGEWDPKQAGQFFEQWLDRTGAPRLQLQEIQSSKRGAEWRVQGILAQSAPVYDLEIDMDLQTTGKPQDSAIKLSGHTTSFGIGSGNPPTRLTVDPEVNLFRLLYPEEIPATVNSIKGAKDLIAVLSDNQPAESRSVFELLLESLDQAGLHLVREAEVDSTAIQKRNFFFFGLPRSEALRALVTSNTEGLTLSFDHFALSGVFSSDTNDCLFAALSDRHRSGRVVALFMPIPGTGEQSVTTAARKITHYGKYSYLAFAQGNNQAKGTWPISNSPLLVNFKENP